MARPAQSRIVYRTTPDGVKYAAILSPLVASAAANVVLGLAISTAFLVAGQQITVGLVVLLAFMTVVLSLAALAVTGPITYLTGGPLMAAGWALAHWLGWRGPRAMALVMAGIGAPFGAFIGAAVSPDIRFMMIGAASGLIAGATAGAFISLKAYERVAPPEPGVDAAPG
jgi:hypothetical protein